MKTFASLIVALVVLASCSTSKTIQSGNQPMSKTTIAGTTAPAVDSAILKREVFNSIIRNKINFRTFNGKAKIEYKIKGDGDDATAYIRIIKDSVVWLSLRGLLGIEGFRILITKNDVTVLNYLEGTVQRRGISYLKQITGLPFTFETVQDLIIGNPVFVDSNIVYYTVDNTRLNVLMRGLLLRHEAAFDKADNKILESHLHEASAQGNRDAVLLYSNYDNSAGAPFSTKRTINLSGQTSLDVNIDFKSAAFNDAVSIPFNVPDDYKKL